MSRLSSSGAEVYHGWVVKRSIAAPFGNYHIAPFGLVFWYGGSPCLPLGLGSIM